MYKPGNVEATYPMVNRFSVKEIAVPESFHGQVRIDVWIPDPDDPRDILYGDDDAVDWYIKQILKIKNGRYVNTYNVVFWP